MATYLVDDGGSSTSPYETWAKAAVDLKTLDDAVTFASGDIIAIGHNTVDTFSYSGNVIFSGPATGPPVTLISCTQGTGSAASGLVYQVGSENQIDTDQAGTYSYRVTFDQSWAVYGVRVVAGQDIYFLADQNEPQFYYDCTFRPDATRSMFFEASNAGLTNCIRCSFDFTADTGNTAADMLKLNDGLIRLIDCVIANGSNRTGNCLEAANLSTNVFISGMDFSSLTNATACELINCTTCLAQVEIVNSLTAATFTPLTSSSTYYAAGAVKLTGVGDANEPWRLVYEDLFGLLYADDAITRTGGGSIEGTSYAWGGPTDGIETSSQCTEDTPFYTPWMYGNVSATGTYTFDVYITNDNADFNDNEVWLEVEYKDDATSDKWNFATDYRLANGGDRLDTVSAQTDDASSTWAGDDHSFTYKQKLSVTGLTIGTAGLYRARVAIGVTSIPASYDFYVDPLVTVTAE
jgi:hypothetical protein